MCKIWNSWNSTCDILTIFIAGREFREPRNLGIVKQHETLVVLERAVRILSGPGAPGYTQTSYTFTKALGFEQTK